MKFFSLFSRVGFSNTYLVGPDGGGDAVLIDPGVFDAPLLQAIEGNRLYVRSILVTHTHNAHINGIRSLLKVYEATIYANQPSVLDFPARHIAEGDLLSLGGFEVRVIETPGHSIDYSFIAAKIAECCKKYRVEGIFVDRWRIDELKKHLDDYDLNIELTPCGQGFRDMAAVVDVLEKHLLDQKLELNDNPVLRFMAASTSVVADAAGSRKFDKASSMARIDGIVTLGMALRAYELLSGGGGSIYDSPEIEKLYGG